MAGESYEEEFIYTQQLKYPTYKYKEHVRTGILTNMLDKHYKIKHSLFEIEIVWAY
jgi:hypothetical protein